ncbi:hypothetical protein EKO27_g11440 [Xylaria grammica]|uniref:Uncharacterized protein n=1 Tax=Xylaria grammica TaxID=363999 RepID=A0A439CNB8_9PEZI|nr:hypothetical protein EKO27_g11440 [Xylaria grammica]
MVTIPRYANERVVFVLEEVKKAIMRGDIDETYDQVIQDFEDKFGARDVGMILVRHVSQMYEPEIQQSRRWANMRKLHSKTLPTMDSSDTTVPLSGNPGLDTSKSTTTESSDYGDQEDLSPPLSSYQQQPSAAQQPAQNAQVLTPEPSTSPTSPTPNSESSSDTLDLESEVDDSFDGASSSRFATAIHPRPPHVGMTTPTVRRTAGTVGYGCHTAMDTPRAYMQLQRPYAPSSCIRQRHTIYPQPRTCTPSPFPHAHPRSRPASSTYTPMANPNMPKPGSGHTWQTGRTGTYEPDIYPINMFTGERLRPNPYKRAHAEPQGPQGPQGPAKHARIDEGVENYGVWDGTKFYFTADPDRQTFQWPRQDSHAASQADNGRHTAQPCPGVSTESSTECEVYDISDPSADVLLEKPSTTVHGTSAPESSTTGSQNDLNKDNNVAASSGTNI